MCHICFQCICEYWRGKVWRIAHNLPNLPFFSPTKIFPCAVYCLMSLGKEKSCSYLMIRDSFINLLLDNFKAQTTSSFLKLLDSYNFDIVLLPANCTDSLQPLYLNVNKSAKDFCTHSFKTGMQIKSFHQLQEGSEVTRWLIITLRVNPI